jgi:sialate O-acetylesterase
MAERAAARPRRGPGAAALALGFFGMLAGMARADVRLASILGSGMVLQRGAPVRLWGFAEPGEAITVRASWSAAAVETAGDEHGAWRLELDPPANGPGPFSISIRGRNEVVLEDLLVGEVWLCGGQSNMEWTLGPGVGYGVTGWEEAAAAADLPRLRFFTVAHQAGYSSAADVTGTWQRATPESVRSLSAVAFFFGRELERELDVPIGLVVSAWGGTPAEAWTSRAALAAFPEFAAELALQARNAADPEGERRAFEVAWKAWWARLDELDPLPARRSDTGWTEIELPSAFEPRLGEHDGTAWFARELELPAAWAGTELVLELGAIDDMDTVYVDGARVAGTEAYGAFATPRSYRIAAGRLSAGKNELLVRVLDTGGPGGFAGEPAELRLGPAEREERLSLAGTWSARRGIALDDPRLGALPAPSELHPEKPGVLFDGMIAPLVPLGIRGAIFYQGEANVGRAEQYRRLLPALIADWRAAFGHELPFLYVQIAPFAYPGDTGEAALLREAQAFSRAVPATGMAVTMDIGDPLDIHPANKLDVGGRLALHALAKAYGRDVACEGPAFRRFEVEGALARVVLDHAAGLTTYGEEPRGFELAGADGVFHPASARIEGETVVLSSPDVPAPRAMRFGWDAGALTNLWNGDGLPAGSFRSSADGK